MPGMPDAKIQLFLRPVNVVHLQLSFSLTLCLSSSSSLPCKVGERRRWCYDSGDWNWPELGDANCVPEKQYNTMQVVLECWWKLYNEARVSF